MLLSLSHFFRLAWAALVFAREGVFGSLDEAVLPAGMRLPLAMAKILARRRDETRASRLAAAIARLGPSYVKLGQFLATRPDVVGIGVALDLEALQDRMEAFPRAVAIGIVEAGLGRKIGDIFIDFGDAVAAASIAQVHRARVRDEAGERDVAVKVLRPAVEQRFRRDLSDMYFAARLAERNFAEARRLRLVEVVDTLARTVRVEMDFRLEAAAASEFGENVAGDADFRVPAVDWTRTAKTVLTLEWIDGVPLSDADAFRHSGFDPRTIARVLVQSFLRQAMRDGLFHADMHRGNLFVDRAGRLAAVDFGIMGRIGPPERRFLAEILYGFIVRDYHRVAEVHFEAGYVPPNQALDDFAQAIRAVGEPIHARRADQISMARVLTLLFEITALFEMRTRPELVLLQKTMVVVEGVARALDPQLDMWTAADPVVRSWIEENLGPAGRLESAGRDAGDLARRMLGLPRFLDRADSLMRRLEATVAEGVPLSAATIDALALAQARRGRWRRLALGVILLLMALALWLR